MFNKSMFDKYLDQYLQVRIKEKNNDLTLWNECFLNFQSHWDLEALDLYTMFSNAFRSTISTRLWKSDDYHPRDVMLEFISYDKEIVRSIFRDLLDDTRDIGGRMERFVFYCDQLLGEIQSRGSKSYSHYHASYFMVSVYLAFTHPEKYTYYGRETFSRAMGKIKAKVDPSIHDFQRYFKVISIFKRFISSHNKILEIEEVYHLNERFGTSIMAYDLLRFIDKN